MQPIVNSHLSLRLGKFVIILGALLLFVYGFLPILTNVFAPLHSMSQYLEANGIDPTRYFYTDVEQVAEGEDYLDAVLNKE